MLTVVGVPFVGKNREGDFEYMMSLPKYARTVFIFNDNVVDASVKQPFKGAGSAVIRPHSFRYNPDASPRAIGIPTGWAVESGGFKLKDGSLEPFASRAITLAIERLVIACTIFRSEVDGIVFSSGHDTETLGCSIFKLEPEILTFIMSRLTEVPDRVENDPSKFTLARLNDLDRQITDFALVKQENALLRGGPKRPRDDNLVILPQRVDRVELVYVGELSCGKHVYEKVNRFKKQAGLYLFSQASPRLGFQSTAW